MQCTSFLPGFYSSRDLNVGANGSAWTLHNDQRTLNNVHSPNFFFPLPTNDQFLVYDKEVMRQTILQHESIFRHQVNELHRLYTRQRELMDDIKRRNLSKPNLHSQSNDFLPKISSESAQRMCQIPSLPWVNPAASRISILIADNFQSASTFPEPKSTQASQQTDQTEDNLKDCKLLLSKCDKPKKKMFDLELPADEYIDSEDEDRFEEKMVSKMPEMLAYPTKRMQEVSQNSDLEPFPCANLLNSISQGSSSSPDPFSRRTNDLADLNEPLWLDAVDLNLPPSCLINLEIAQQNVGSEDGATKHEDSQAQLSQPREMPDQRNKPSEEREDSCQKALVFSQSFSAFVCDEAKPKRFKTSDASEDKDAKSNQENSDDVSIGVIVDTTITEVENQIDLNFCINEDESSPKLSLPMITKPVAEIDLEAPVSPENMECAPPRGESEENPLETPIMLSKEDSPENKECTPPRGESEENPLEAPIKLSKEDEDGDQKDELVRMAAEAIVLISTPGFQKLLLENIFCERLEPSSVDSLDWFAGVVSSLANELENEVGVVLSHMDGGDQQEILSDGSDYFETMTVELTETKVGEYWFKSDAQIEEETVADFSRCQPRRGRTMRGRQLKKSFQTEVLPSLSSLSRHEVTEDLQMIGGLMGATGFLVGPSPGRRNGSRNSKSRARRRLGKSFCHGMENTVCSVLKPRNSDIDFAFGERSLKGWGKVNRRRRGPRIPASNPPLIFG